MKKIICLLFTFCSLLCSAQDAEQSFISIHAVVPEYQEIPAEALTNLETKLQSLVAQNGSVSGYSNTERFLITAKVDVTEKEITPTTPVKIVLKTDITLIIGDAIEDKIYETKTLSLSGIGSNETKAYIACFQKIKPSNPQLQQFVTTAKNKIMDYYKHNCSKILADADRLATMGQYDEAITMTITVPPVCSDCYNSCQSKSVEIYSMKKAHDLESINKDGLALIQKARAAWSVRHDYECAAKALDLLSQVDPEVPCAETANTMVDEINSYLRKEEAQKAAAAAAAAKAQWEFKMRQYEDNLAMAKQRQENTAAILGTLANRFGKIEIGIKKERTFGWAKRSK